MFEFLWLIPALPFTGAIILAISGGRLSKTLTAIIGAGSVGISALLTIFIGLTFLTSPPPAHSFTQNLWSWIALPGFKSDIALRLDALSLTFIFIITFVGFLIHLYSTEFMRDEEGYSRFFAYMNLFVGSMLTLVLADNLLLLYFGWEGVGLCSYLLIGFWYKEPANDYAARKAFTVTRIGDTAMIIALFILYNSFGTLNIHELMYKCANSQINIVYIHFPLFTFHCSLFTIIALLLLGGAVGKSAQLPLQTWLPDAMAGPSPVSALIHAATMVTAGVYLIARTNVLFTLSPFVQTLVAVIGTLTLVIAGFSALTQHDIKRVLAYSTISQIGYMFLALGLGAFSAGIFHFMIHAFFKALLFLAAGVVILAQHHEHNMFKMGGLRKKLPVVFWTFIIGSASLAALPLITAGFYSKDTILWYAYAGKSGNIWLWAGAVTGAFITALYSFRMIFITFYGEQKIEISYKAGKLMLYPLIILAAFSIVGGFIETPDTLGNVTVFSGFIASALPPAKLLIESKSTELFFQVITAIIALAGIYLAYKVRSSEFGVRSLIYVKRFLLSGWGFDWLYDKVIVRPIVFFAEINKNDFIDKFFEAIAWINGKLYNLFSRTQTGRIRTYVMGITLGILLILTLILVFSH